MRTLEKICLAALTLSAAAAQAQSFSSKAIPIAHEMGKAIALAEACGVAPGGKTALQARVVVSGLARYTKPLSAGKQEGLALAAAGANSQENAGYCTKVKIFADETLAKQQTPEGAAKLQARAKELGVLLAFAEHCKFNKKQMDYLMQVNQIAAFREVASSGLEMGRQQLDQRLKKLGHERGAQSCAKMIKDINETYTEVNSK